MTVTCVDEESGAPQPARSRLPGARFLISRRTLALTPGGVARVRVSCRQRTRCLGSLTLRITDPRPGAEPRTLVIARRAFDLPRMRRAIVRMRLSEESTRLIVQLRRIRVRATARLEPQPGRGTKIRTTRSGFRLLAPRQNFRDSRPR